MFWVHEDGEDGRKLLDLLLLVPYGIEEFLLLILVLVLDISQLGEVSDILLLYLCEPLLDLVDLLVEVLVVLLDVEELALPLLLLLLVFLLLLLLRLEFLLQLPDFLQFILVLPVWPFVISREHFLQVLKFLLE